MFCFYPEYVILAVCFQGQTLGTAEEPQGLLAFLVTSVSISPLAILGPLRFWGRQSGLSGRGDAVAQPVFPGFGKWSRELVLITPHFLARTLP